MKRIVCPVEGGSSGGTKHGKVEINERSVMSGDIFEMKRGGGMGLLKYRVLFSACSYSMALSFKDIFSFYNTVHHSKSNLSFGNN